MTKVLTMLEGAGGLFDFNGTLPLWQFNSSY
jgi:hypothetical protein